MRVAYNTIEKRRAYHREYQKKWRLANPEKAKERDLKNYEARKEKQSEYAKEKYRKTVAHYMISNARKRAEQYNVPFSINKEDIAIPEYCPILTHLRLKVGKAGGSDYSPTLDRIIPSEGYVKGNIQVISHLANRIKSNASLKDLIAVGEWAKRVSEL